MTKVTELGIVGEFVREEKSELEKAMENATVTLDFTNAASELFADLEEELIEQGHFGKYVIIKEQPDGSAALEVIVPNMKEAMKYVDHNTFIEQIGR